MSAGWEAVYLDGRTAARRPARVTLFREGLEIHPEGAPALRWPYAEVRQTQGFTPGEQVRLERGPEPGEALVVSDPGFLAAYQQAAGGGAPALEARLSRHRLLWTAVAGLAALAVLAALYLWGIPALARAAASRVPAAWEERLGRSVADSLAPAERRCGDPRLQAAVDAIMARLTAALPEPRHAFHVRVLDEGAVNAFAAPGGHLVVLRGLLQRTDSPEELAGVLAHEIQHVVRQHATQALIQQAGLALLLAALTGDVSGAAALGAEAARTLAALRYSRLVEEEADEEGLRLLLAAGVDPEGLLTFFAKLARQEGRMPGALVYLSTHPDPAARLARLRALAGPPRPPGARLLPGADWSQVRGLCRVRQGGG